MTIWFIITAGTFLIVGLLVGLFSRPRWYAYEIDGRRVEKGSGLGVSSHAIRQEITVEVNQDGMIRQMEEKLLPAMKALNEDLIVQFKTGLVAALKERGIEIQ